MKIAIVCDDLIQNGGSEKIFEAVSEMWPKAVIFTSVVSKEWLKKLNDRGFEVKTSFIQKLPFASKLNRYYSLFFLHIIAFESFDFSNYDLVFSISSRYAHFVITKPATKHVCYLNSPGRMFWEPFDYFEKETFGLLKLFMGFGKKFVMPFLSAIRIADYAAMHRVDVIISNSITTQGRLKKYFGINSQIVNPYVETPNFDLPKTSEDFYLVLTRLVSWKRVDLAIAACSSLNKKLKIVGTGPDNLRLKSMAGDNVEFMGFLDSDQKWSLLRSCKALINTQKEDFGIVPLEAMWAGKPVIAYGLGGALETVVQGKTGIFFDEQTPEVLEKAILELEGTTFDPTVCRERARDFSKDKFKCSILKSVGTFGPTQL